MQPQISIYPQTLVRDEILPPYWTEESDQGFSVGFDMLACEDDSVHFMINKQQRHLTVTASLEGADSDVEYLWTFTLPHLADLDHVEIKRRGRVYELKFPRLHGPV